MNKETQTATQAIVDRLHYNDIHNRADIIKFAIAARDIVLGKQPCAGLLSKIQQMAPQIEEQLAAECQFPPGVRLDTFSHSPVLAILACANGGKSTVPVTKGDILSWLRRETGWDKSLDDLVDRATGVRLPVLATELAKLHLQEPVSFYLLMSFQFEHDRLDTTITCPASERHKGERLRPFHREGKLIDAVRAIAEWMRAIAIAHYLFGRQDAHHLVLRERMLGVAPNGSPTDHVTTVIDAMPLPIPMLRVLLNGTRPFAVADMLAEFERVLMPSLELGNGTKRPLYHFWGLGYVEVLMVAFLDIVCVRRAIAAPSNATNGVHVREPHFEHFGQLLLVKVVEGTITNRWPDQYIELKEDAALRSKILRRRYARASVVVGSAYRFDPAFWSNTERDAPLFARLAMLPNGRPSSNAFPHLVGLIRDTLHAALLIKMDTSQIPFGARVVSHLMTATTVLTRDPALLVLLEHAMWQSGYRSNRNACRKPRCRKSCKCVCNAGSYRLYPGYAARNWGCVLPVSDLSSRRYPELPRKGEHSHQP